MCFCRSNARIPCSFCDSKINIYIYWLSRLWIYHYFEYVECNIWYLALVSHAKLHPFNAHTWKSLPPKSLFVDKYENDTHAHVYPQYDTYVAEFHKKRKMYTSSVADNGSHERVLGLKNLFWFSMCFLQVCCTCASWDCYY
jgi:hypothetical protein